ncbi:MAG: DUF3090 family protein [Chloroflexi bacterium]|nr:MAG: DUF3090 family protein [Chloroflexota bacterium]
MPGELIDFRPVTRITIDAVGPPGQRVFLLQASYGNTTVTLKLEKEQARVLAVSILELLDELNEKYPRPLIQTNRPLSSDLILQEPMEPVFAIGQIGLGYETHDDLVVLVVQELRADEQQDLSTARFWATREQMQAMSEHALKVVEHGRPICPLCDQPIDPDGHFCPKTNGHEKKWV